MRIDKLIRNRRRGSLALEAIMALPVIIVMVFLTRFVLDAMLMRHETAVYTRGSTVRAAAAVQSPDGALSRTTQCWHDDSDRNARPGVDRTYGVWCYWRNAEIALPEQTRFGRTMIDRAGDEDWLLDDLHMDRVMNDVTGWGGGSVRFQQPPFLEATPGDEAGHMHLRPTHDYWSYASDDRWARGHDRAIWNNIFVMQSDRLFPNVFPSR